MTEPLPLAEIRRRAAALRMSGKVLSALSGLPTATIYEVLRGRSRHRHTKRTLQMLTDGVLLEEAFQLARLSALDSQDHPQLEPPINCCNNDTIGL